MKSKKRKKYQVRVNDGSGKRFPAKSFDRKVDADAYKAELLLLRNKGLTQETVRAGEMSFESYKEKWLLECNSHNSEGWKQSQNQMLRDHILPLMKDWKIGSIKKRDIELLINSAKDKGLSPQTQKHIFNLIHKMLKDAFAHFEFILANPAAKVIPPSVPKKSREFLRLTEIKAILEKCNGHWLEPVIWLGICAGMRIGEIQALKWDCVDFENNIITIKASYCRKERRIKDHPKQKDWGSAPIIPDLKRCLLKLRPANADSGFVTAQVSAELHLMNLDTQPANFLCLMEHRWKI